MLKYFIFGKQTLFFLKDCILGNGKTALEARKSNSKNMTPPPESKKKFSQGRVTGVSFVIGLLFLVLAVIYAQAPCENSAITFLLITGILQLSHFVVGALKPKDLLLPILTLQEFAISIWGMFVIFKAYSGWQHESPSVAGYCPKVPFLTAFAYLVANAVGSLIVLCLACFCLIYTCVA